MESWAQRVIKEYGPPDLLLNNAALMNQTAPLWQVPHDEFSQLVDVNVKGVFHVVQRNGPSKV